MKVLDLFSGIGGFSLGLERAGMQTVAFCEIEEFPRKVLNKHWPEVPIYDDIKQLTAKRLKADGIPAIDLVCGGVPCQPASQAGKRGGEEDHRWLWPEAVRVISEFSPEWFIFENVSGMLSLNGGLAFERTLLALEAQGYEVFTFIIPACAVGAPHRRDRIWIVGYSAGKGPQGCSQTGNTCGDMQNKPNISKASGERIITANTIMSNRSHEPRNELERKEHAKHSNCRRNDGQVVANAISGGQSGSREPINPGDQAEEGKGEANYAFNECIRNQWAVEPDVGRVAHGVPSRVDRLKGLGNAVVPQIPEIIGRAIMEIENQ